MKLKHGGNVQTVPIDRIDVGVRTRPLDQASVDMMMASVAETGVIFDPIMLRSTGDRFELIDGRHRLEVGRNLEWGTIEARIWECSKKEARFMEVTANLSVAHLTPLDFAVNLAERKAAYEELHPETKAGVAGGRARQGQQPTEMSFADFMAGVLRKSPRQVQRVVSVGEKLSHDERRWLRDAPVLVTMADLETISKIGDDKDRAQVCIALTNGAAKNAAAAVKARSLGAGKAAPGKPPVERSLQKLLDTFDRAPKAARAAFVRDRSAELLGLLRDLDAGLSE